MISFCPACAACVKQILSCLDDPNEKSNTCDSYKGGNHTNFQVEKSDPAQVGANES